MADFNKHCLGLFTEIETTNATTSTDMCKQMLDDKLAGAEVVKYDGHWISKYKIKANNEAWQKQKYGGFCIRNFG